MTSAGEEMPRLRLLFVVPFPPRLGGSHGGGHVAAALIGRLAERHSVALVCIRGEDEPPTDEDITVRCDLLEEVIRPEEPLPGLWRNRVRQLAKLAGAPPNLVEHASVEGFADRLRSAVSAFQPEIVQMEMTEMAQYLPALAGCSAHRVLADLDPGPAAASDFSSSARGLRRLWRRLDTYAWARYASRAYSAFDAIVVLTERDRRTVERYASGVAVTTIPFSVELPEHPLDPRGADPPSLLFFGGFRHPPNADAARRLMRTIFPCVLAHRPETVLELVGPDPTPDMHALAGSNVAITGWVDSVTPYLERAAVVVVPLRLGGGMRVKVFETLAAGKALVASPRAVEGLDIVPDRDFLLAESDEEFCAAISELLSDVERRVELASNARRWAEATCSEDRRTETYEALYRRLLTGELIG